MRRWSFWVMLVVGLALVSTTAEAGRGKKRRGKRSKQEGAPTSEEVGKALGKLKWGMSKDQVVKVLINQVKEEYRPKIAKTRDAVEEDRLRHEAGDRIQAIRKSYVEFNGEPTGWDASFLKPEFGQNNGESLVVMRDGNSQNFYFFHNGGLWKWYKAFESKTFGGKAFKGFAAIVQAKFGKGKIVQKGEYVPGVERRWVEWQNKDSRLRAVDLTSFYGFYSLVFEDKDKGMQLFSQRKAEGTHERKRHALVDSVTGGDSFEPDDSPDIVDRLTGKTRSRPEPRDESAMRSAKRRSGRSSSDDSSSSRPATTEELIGDDDPLKGL